MTLPEIVDTVFPSTFKKTPLMDELAALRTAIKTAIDGEFGDRNTMVEITTFMNTVTCQVYRSGLGAVVRTSIVTNESLL